MEQIISQSEALFCRSKSIVPGGVHSPVRAFKGVGGVPRFITSAKKTQIKDVDGNEYTDYCMSWGPLIFGHQDPECLEAIQKAIQNGWSFGTTEPYSLELAELIINSIPWVEKIRFVNSGTEAVMAALRVARAATGRSKILKFDGCYHGHVDSMLVRAGSGLAEMAKPDSAGVTSTVATDTIVVPLNDLEGFKEAISIHKSKIAAVILEPVPANHGLLVQTLEFLKSVVELARSEGILVLFDEVITGFRVAFGGMAEKTGLIPDLVTYGKIIGGGFPVGAYGGRNDLMDLVAPEGPVYQAGTLSANPIAMTAGLVTLKKLKKNNPYLDLEEKTEKFCSSIEKILAELHISGQVQRFASLFWIVFGKIQSTDQFVRRIEDIPTEHKQYFSKIFNQMLKRGIYLAPSAYEVSFLSTVHEESHFEQFISKLREAIQEVPRI